MKQIKLFAAVIALLSAFSSNAQFTASTNPEFTAGASAGVSKTCNDSRYFRNCATCPMSLMNVVGWDGANPAVYYYIPGGLSGTIALPAGATAPDVILSADLSYTNLYMVVVYTLSGNFVFAPYKWTGTTFAATPVSTYGNASGSYNATINIDATKNGSYAVIMGNSDASIVVADGTNASLPSGPATFNSLPAGTGTQTDICLNSDAFGANTRVHISFTDPTATKLLTIPAAFTTLTFGATVTIAPFTPGKSYAEPRIASPNNNAPSCPGTEVFSVIYNEVNATFYYIHQYNQDATGITNAVLTGGAFGFPLAIQYSKRPAVTYNEKWSYSFGGSGTCVGATASGWVSASSTRSVIGEKTLSNGTMWGPVTYYDFNNPIRPNCDLVSISSKYASDRVQVAYYDYSSNKIIYKLFGWGDPTMRTVKSNTELKKNITVYPNPATDHIYLNTENLAVDAVIHVSVTDITGRAAYSYTGELQNLQAAANVWFAGIIPGVYYVQVSDNDGYTQSLKLMKQ